jgi:DNA-binding CsgD family transcriptional regulator
VANATAELASRLGGDFPLLLDLVIRAWLAVYSGHQDDARPVVADAIDASKRSGTRWLEDWSITALGFLETSLGNYDAALSALEPLLSRHAAAPDATEIFAAAFLPDAVEALTGLGRVDEAEALVEALERNGARLDRAWMLAVGARCRAVVLAARGDVDAAVQSARCALIENDRLPMPFERARSSLVLGQLLQRSEAAAMLRAALTTFEWLGTPRWADRARAELDGTAAGSRAPAGPQVGLTPAEQRVAELAASGLTNREVAATLFISTKTVEASLARVYRKLGIESRAELEQRIGDAAPY